MNRDFSPSTVDKVCDVIERHAGRGGFVNMRALWREVIDVGLDPVMVEEIVRRLSELGRFCWLWGEQLILVKPVRCPACNRCIHERLTVHMHDAHPRPTSAIVRIEWA